MSNQIENLGPTPTDETCVQLGDENYSIKARAECLAYKNQLLRMYQSAHKGALLPTGCRLIVTNEEHDFGTYHEVGVKFNCDDKKCTVAAYWLEAHVPLVWDDKARKELALYLTNDA
jgi:hypothetical protein